MTPDAKKPSKRLRVLLPALVVVLVALAATPALAARQHEFKTTFGSHCLAEPGCTGEELFKPSGVAVNEATGDVYVVDTGEAGQHGRVVRFDSAGVYQSEFNGSGTLLNGKGEHFEGKEAGSGEEPGEVKTGRFEEPEGIAIDNDPSSPSYQDVYVVATGIKGNQEHFVIDKYSREGEYLGQITKGGESGGRIERSIEGIAVDPTGDVWVYLAERTLSEYSSAIANEFLSPAKPVSGLSGLFESPGLAVDAAGDFYLGQTPEPEDKPRIAKTNPSAKVTTQELDNEESSAVAVDQATNDAYVDNVTSVAAFNPATEEFERFGAGHLTQGAGIGVNAGTGAVYVADPVSGPVVVFGYKAPSAPKVENESFAAVTKDSVTLAAEINPQSEPNEQATTYRFEYGACSSLGQCAASGYEASVPAPEGQIGPDFNVHSVSVEAEGLKPDTAYHFRAVATNGHGEGEPGEEQTFTTEAAGGELVLPDNRGWELVSPPDKHGSLIEPIQEAGVVQAAAGGDGITYQANTPTESQPAGYSNEDQVLSRRSSASWSSSDIAIPHSSGASGFSLAAGPEYRFFDSELTQSIVQPLGPFVPQLSEEASESTAYLHDLSEGCGTRCYRPLVTGKPGFANVDTEIRFGEDEACQPRGNGFKAKGTPCGPEFLGASADLSHVVLKSTVPLQSGLEPGGLYEWSAGSLQPVSVLPDGSSAPATPEVALGTTLNLSARNAISSDGSRIVWSQGSVGSPPSLYQREMNLGKTIQLDAAEPACLEKPEPGHECESGDGQFQIANAEGSRMLFTDDRELTKGSGASPKEKEADLYECQITISEGKARCELTDLTPERNGEGANVQGSVLGASEDTSFVYFVADGVQSEAANARGQKPVKSEPNLYVAHDGQISFITTLSTGDHQDWSTTDGISDLASQPTRVSPSGQFLEFMSQASPTGYDNRDVATDKAVAEVYLYDAATNKLACASCMPSGARPIGVEYDKLLPSNGGKVGGPTDIWPDAALVAANVPGWPALDAAGAARYQPRYLNNEGRLFFNTADALVPQDSNGTQDVYEYEPQGIKGPENEEDCTSAISTFSERNGGCVSLISSGRSAQESAFMDASVSGDDVFFLTSAKLSPLDTDTAYDIYDAHVCTHAQPCITFPNVQSPPCTTEASCKAAPTPQPSIFGAPASATFQGPGNLAPAVAVKAKAKPLTRAQKLAAALKTCKKKPKKQRAGCVKEARKRYGPTKKSKKGGKR